MNVIDIIKARSESVQREFIEVPEWSGTKVYYRPLTINEYTQISKSISKDNTVGLVDTLIIKAETEDGKKMFTLADKPIIMASHDMAIVTRIAAKILDTLDVGEAEKN